MSQIPLDAAAVAALAAARVRPFAGRVIHRQRLVQWADRLWEPVTDPWRWSAGFPAVYASLALEVAIAERIKRTLARPVRIVVGVATVRIARVLDLNEQDSLHTLGLTTDSVTAGDYALTQQLGRMLRDAGVAGALVPAAIMTTAALYPRFRMVRDGRATIHRTPSQGINLVIYPENLRRGDEYPEVERLTCEVRGLRR